MENIQANIIEVRNLRKVFKVYPDKGHSLKEKVLFRSRNRYEEKEVIRDISFSVERGQAVGLVGENGCGKSTILKMLTGIMYPTSGEIITNGRISSLLELGAGFHPDMTGRENIYINASIYGLTRKEIDKRIDKIIRFSELEESIDNPVRTYSSGMYARLAFSVSINVDADILLIDEILAVGDANFQTKCFNKLIEIKNKGTTIIIVSHSQDSIEKICDRAIWINGGIIACDDRPVNVFKKYVEYMGEQRNQSIKREKEADQIESEEDNKKELVSKSDISTEEKQDDIKHIGNGEAYVTGVFVCDESGNKRYVFGSNSELHFKVEFVTYEAIPNAIYGLSIYKKEGYLCYGTNTGADGFKSFKLAKGRKYEFEYILPKHRLMNGVYFLAVCVADQNEELVDFIYGISEFEIISSERDIGVIRMDHTWKIEGKAYEYNI